MARWLVLSVWRATCKSLLLITGTTNQRRCSFGWAQAFEGSAERAAETRGLTCSEALRAAVVQDDHTTGSEANADRHHHTPHSKRRRSHISGSSCCLRAESKHERKRVGLREGQTAEVLQQSSRLRLQVRAEASAIRAALAEAEAAGAALQQCAHAGARALRQALARSEAECAALRERARKETSALRATITEAQARDAAICARTYAEAAALTTVAEAEGAATEDRAREEAHMLRAQLAEAEAELAALCSRPAAMDLMGDDNEVKVDPGHERMLPLSYASRWEVHTMYMCRLLQTCADKSVIFRVERGKELDSIVKKALSLQPAQLKQSMRVDFVAAGAKPNSKLKEKGVYAGGLTKEMFSLLWDEMQGVGQQRSAAVTGAARCDPVAWFRPECEEGASCLLPLTDAEIERDPKIADEAQDVYTAFGVMVAKFVVEDVYRDIAAISGENHACLRITPDARGVAYAARNQITMDMVLDESVAIAGAQEPVTLDNVEDFVRKLCFNQYMKPRAKALYWITQGFGSHDTHFPTLSMFTREELREMYSGNETVSEADFVACLSFEARQ
ncbi:hypothetical protein JKP88DRAFT_244762 [Tribonema minus]|uniref:HECT domain-containing protein n=1 Tax=Tribonema minus TaxID=303371 RepID=A0A836CI21_9STRA|nr:hypothetical protein JKP88DRAFT_244762 [Tribonema minus]